MKIDHGQKMFAGSVASALVRAWTERLGLRVVVEPRGGTSVAELTDDTGRVVWSQSAEGVQFALPFAGTAPRAIAAPPSPLVRVTCPAHPSLHPQDWADKLGVSFLEEGLVRWEMSRPSDDEGTAWTFVPRRVGERVVERLAEAGLTAALADADPDGEVMLLAVHGAVVVRGEQWQVRSLAPTRTTLTSLAGEVREVDTGDVRWIGGGFCCVAPPPKPKKLAATPKAKGARS